MGGGRGTGCCTSCRCILETELLAAFMAARLGDELGVPLSSLWRAGLARRLVLELRAGRDAGEIEAETREGLGLAPRRTA